MYAARYADGRSAEVRDVSVHVLGDALRILDGQGVPLAVWSVERVEALSPVPRDFGRAPLVLRPLPEGDVSAFARLTLTEPEAAQGLLAELAPLLRRHARRSRRRWLAAGLLIWACVIAVWMGLPLLSRHVAPLVPPAWEDGLGRQTRRQVGVLLAGTGGERAWVELDPAGRQVLDRLVERLENADVEGLPSQADGAPPLRVYILKSKVVNAFAVPGSSIIVTTGLLNEIESLDELAAVLAHERAHVRLRHTTQHLLRNVAFEYLVDVLGGGSQVGTTAAQYLVTVGWSRDMEREADEKGLETLRRARISPAGFTRFFRRLAGDKDQAGRLSALLGTHPGSLERARRAEGLAPYPTAPLFGEDFWKETGLGRAEVRPPSEAGREKSGPRHKLDRRGRGAPSDKNIDQARAFQNENALRSRAKRGSSLDFRLSSSVRRCAPTAEGAATPEQPQCTCGVSDGGGVKLERRIIVSWHGQFQS